MISINMNQKWVVYQITNTINKKYYRGKTYMEKWQKDYGGSSKPLDRAYKKYGKDNFVREILATFDSADEAYDYEEFVVKTKREDKKSYNIIQGGKGGGSGEDHPNFKYSNKFLKNCYDPNKTIKQNSTINGIHLTKLYASIIKYVLKNNLPHVKGQVCLGYEDKYSSKNLGKIYDPTKTIKEIAGKNGCLYRALVKYVIENNLPHVRNQGCLGYEDKTCPKNLKKLYNPTKTISQNAMIDGKRSGGLYRALIKHVVENDLSYVPNQKCIAIYKKKAGI